MVGIDISFHPCVGLNYWPPKLRNWWHWWHFKKNRIWKDDISFVGIGLVHTTEKSSQNWHSLAIITQQHWCHQVWNGPHLSPKSSDPRELALQPDSVAIWSKLGVCLLGGGKIKTSVDLKVACKNFKVIQFPANPNNIAEDESQVPTNVAAFVEEVMLKVPNQDYEYQQLILHQLWFWFVTIASKQ